MIIHDFYDPLGLGIAITHIKVFNTQIHLKLQSTLGLFLSLDPMKKMKGTDKDLK